MRFPTYKVKGTRWKQLELLYGEDFAVRKLCAAYSDLPHTDEALPQFMERMFSDGTLPAFGALVLKPHEPTAIHRWWNQRACLREGITRENVVEFMDRAQIAEVIRDFFVLREQWIARFLDAPAMSALTSRKLELMKRVLQPS